MKKITATSLLFILLTACATPPGRLQESDFTWTTSDVSLNYQTVFRNFRENFRQCGYIAEGVLYTDIKEGNFDLYLPNPIGQKSSWVSGTVKLKFQSEEKTHVSVGIINRYDKPVFGKAGSAREKIFKFYSGETHCPASIEN